jgi:hypothetical protein
LQVFLIAVRKNNKKKTLTCIPAIKAVKF